MLFALLSANFLMILAFLFKFNHLPPQIPLFYSKPTGESQLAEWWFIFVLPLILDCLYLLNFLIYKKFFFENQFVNFFIYYFKLFLIIVFTVIFLKIIFLIA